METQHSAKLATISAVNVGDFVTPLEDLAALAAAYLKQFTVHMDETPVTGTFVQIIDILRNEQKIVAQRLFQFS